MTDVAGLAPPTVAPVLTDGVVTLRERVESDVEDMLALARDPETLAWTTVTDPFTRVDARRAIGVTAPRGWAEGSTFCWALEVLDDGRPRFAGHLDLRREPLPEVGYVLAPWARGRGLAVRALRLAADWAFDVAGFPVLHWCSMAGNLASWRVAHACGFGFEGTRTLAHPSRDGLVDSWQAVLRPEPDEPVARRGPVTTWHRPTVLHGERVRLRPFSDTDLPRIVEARQDERSRYWSAHLSSTDYTTDDARRFLRDVRLDESLGGRVCWAVADPTDDRLLGHVTVFGMDKPYTPHGGEVGYWAHPDARGRGAMREAVGLVRDHAFTPVADGGLGRTLLTLGASALNSASRHVAERAGFRLVGEFRAGGVVGVDNEMVEGGVWYDLLAEDPMPDRPSA